MMTTSLRRRVGAGSMVLGLSAGRKRGEGYGGRHGVGGCQGWCDGRRRDGVAGEHRGSLLLSDTGPMRCHTPAPQQGRCGGQMCCRYLSARGWGRTTSSLLWGRGSPSPGTSPCGMVTAVTLGRGTSTPASPAGIWGFCPAGLTCRAPGRAGARCRGGLRTPCHPQLAGALSSVPSRRTQPPLSPASCRSGQWAAPHTGAHQPGTGGS